MRSGRAPVPVWAHEEGERVVLCSPAVGLWRGMPEVGAWLAPGGAAGRIETLGVPLPLVLPAGVGGRVVARSGRGRSTVPVGHGEVLFSLERTGELGGGAYADATEGEAESSGLVFASPMSGRYYGRPGPDKEPFVKEGDVIAVGHTLCLLEVMKTFNRVAYGGAGLPERARVVRVVPADGVDLGAGDPIVEVEPV